MNPLMIASLGLSGLSTISGFFQRAKANRLERENVMPIAQVNSNIAKNQALAQALSKQGLPAPVYNNQLNQMQQGLSTTLRQLGQRGINGTNANAFLRNYNNSLMNLNAQDAQARRANMSTLFNANTALAQEQQRVWNWNQAQPYLRNAENISRLRQSGNNNIVSGIGGITNAFLMNEMFGGNLGGSKGVTPTLPPSSLGEVRNFGFNTNFNMPNALANPFA